MNININPNQHTGTVGLQKLTHIYINKHLCKPKKISMSNWEQRPLTNKQIEYAACDAYVMLELFDNLICGNTSIGTSTGCGICCYLDSVTGQKIDLINSLNSIELQLEVSLDRGQNDNDKNTKNNNNTNNATNKNTKNTNNANKNNNKSNIIDNNTTNNTNNNNTNTTNNKNKDIVVTSRQYKNKPINSDSFFVSFCESIVCV